MKHWRTLALALLLVLGACITALFQLDAVTPLDRYKPRFESTEASRRVLIGRWFGEAVTTDGDKRYWIIVRRPEGVFQVAFRTIAADGSKEDSVETGDWGVSGNILFTITRGWQQETGFVQADPSDANFYDAYELISLENDRITYKSIETKNVFVVRRVHDLFDMPAR